MPESEPKEKSQLETLLTMDGDEELDFKSWGGHYPTYYRFSFKWRGISVLEEVFYESFFSAKDSYKKYTIYVGPKWAMPEELLRYSGGELEPCEYSINCYEIVFGGSKDEADDKLYKFLSKLKFDESLKIKIKTTVHEEVALEYYFWEVIDG
jgi:hypothetical protein